MKKLFVNFLTLIILAFHANAQEGKVITVTIHAPSLEGNLVGDSPDRNVSVYLPPDYDKDLDKRYPVIYLLHGFSGNKTGANNWEWAFNAADINNIITSGTAKPMIIVMPDACNQFGGSMYTNSVTTGFWEDFITYDLTEFVDTNYRSLPERESRGIAGHSMGGYGAIKIAMKHPDVFRSVYGTSSCCMDQNPGNFSEKRVTDAMAVQNLEEIREASFYSKTYLASAAAFSPNPENPPFYADFPFSITGDSLSINENEIARWLANYPGWMADQYVTNLKHLHAISFDAGDKDIPGLKESNQYFSETLNRLNVQNKFEVFEGGHGDKVGDRIKTKILPFFSAALVSDK